MKKIGFLLKLSFISVASTMLVSNDYIQTIIGIGYATAGDILDASKYGNYRDIGKHFIDESIMGSNCNWAKGSLRGNQHTSSIENLIDIVCVSMDEDKFHNNKITREKCLRSKIKTIIDDHSNSSDKYVNIDEWGKTTYGNSVMSWVNSIMACCTVHEYNDSNPYNHSRTVFGKTIEELYDDVFKSVMIALDETNTGNSVTHLGESILNHFGYNDSRDNLDKALDAFKKYLYHDFYCYFVQTGLIRVDEKSKCVSKQSALSSIVNRIGQVDLIRRELRDHQSATKYATKNDFVEEPKKMCITDIIEAFNKNNEVSNFMNKFNATLKSYKCTPLKEDIGDENYLPAFYVFCELSLTKNQSNVLEFHKRLIDDLLNKKIIEQNELTTDLVFFILNEFTWRNYDTLSEREYKPAYDVSKESIKIIEIKDLFNTIELEIIKQAEMIKETAEKLKLENVNIYVLLRAAFVLTQNYNRIQRNSGYDGSLGFWASMENAFEKYGPNHKPWAYDFENIIKEALQRKRLVY